MDDFRKKMNAVVDGAVNGTLDLFAGRRVMYALSFGQHEIPPMASRDFEATAETAFQLLDMGYRMTKWVDDPLPWRWQNRVTRWLLRTVLRRRMPMRLTTPCVIDVFTVGDQKWFMRPVFVQHVAVDVAAPAKTPSSEDDDDGYDPMMNVAIPGGVTFFVRVSNISARPVTLWLGVHGWKVS